MQDVSDDDSYYDDRVTEAGTRFGGSVANVSPVYYVESISVGDFSVIPSQEFIPQVIRRVNGKKSVKIGSIKFDGSIDLDGDPKSFDACSNLLLGANLSDNIDIIVGMYEKMGWAIAKLSADAVSAYLRDEYVDVPVVADDEKFDDLAIDVYNSIVDGEKTVRSIANEFNLSYQQVSGWLKRVQSKGELVPLRRNRVPAVKFPSYKSIKKMLDGAYVKKGNVARSWREFCGMLKDAYPSIGVLSDKSIENRCRPMYRLRSMKPKTARQGRLVLEQLRLEVVQGLLLCRILSKPENHVLFIDQSSFEYDSRRYAVLGGTEHRPHVVLQRPRCIHLYAACSKDGLFACRFSDNSSTSEMAASFVSDVCDRYCQTTGCDVVYVYIDNVRYQHTRVFKDAIKSSRGFPFYGIRGSPFLNIIEDYFLFIKQTIKLGRPKNNNEYFYHMKLGIESVSARKSEMIYKRLFDNVLERIQRYRDLVNDDSMPKGIKRFRIISDVLRLNKEFVGEK